MCWPQDLIALSSLYRKKTTENNFHTVKTEDVKKLDRLIESQCLKLQLSLSHNFMHRQSDIEFFEASQFASVDELVRAFSALWKKCCCFDRLMNTSFFDIESMESVLSSMKKSPSLIQTLVQIFSVNVSENVGGKIDDTVNGDSSSFDSDFSDLATLLGYLLKVNLSNALYEMSKRVGDSIPSRLSLNSNVQNSEATVPDNHSSEAETSECFAVLENAPISHHFYSAVLSPIDTHLYQRTILSDHKMLRKSLPPGVWVRAYEDRMDLLSVMLAGIAGTPYEDGIFLFDIQMATDYPSSPPQCHYISYCSDRLNPNLYEDGTVCVSLLGTWHGKGSELWMSDSTLLQLIVSIQGLILVAEPYFNEVGLDKQKGTQKGHENSRMYNEMVVLKLVESVTKLLSNPPDLFRSEIIKHFSQRGHAMHQRITCWMHNSKEKATIEFPLFPTSRGFCLTLGNLLVQFRKKLDAINQ